MSVWMGGCVDGWVCGWLCVDGCVWMVRGWMVRSIMFGFTCPAYCMFCMVSGVCFRDGTLINWHTGEHTQWVCHSEPEGMPFRGLCYPPHSPCLLGCVHE